VWCGQLDLSATNQMLGASSRLLSDIFAISLMADSYEKTMKQSVITDEIRFKAEMVAADEEEFTPDFVVHGLYFGQGDPEQGGQHWNFTRSLNDDDGVCVVKEIQEVTEYGGIVSFKLTRRSVMCEFNDAAAQSTRTRRLVIEFEIDDETWEAFVMQAKLVFDGEACFELGA
jgi:hypothetical protein